MTKKQEQIKKELNATNGEIKKNGFVYRFYQQGDTKIIEQCQIKTIGKHRIYVLISFWI